MTTYSNERWKALVERTFAKVNSLADTKGSEYSGNTDRLRNFRLAAAALDINAETVWRVYAGKHWDAITTYVKDLEQGISRTRSEPIAGRVNDLIVYSLLLLAMIEEKGEP
jgi:hypothetical protein